MIAQDVNVTSQLVTKGLVQDITEYNHIVPKETIGKLADSGKFSGKTYFLPYRPNVEINYYNETKFNAYNLTPLTTWDELYDVAKTLKEKEGISRVALKMDLSSDVIEIVEFIRSAGGDPLVLNDPGTIKAYKFLQKLWPELSEDTLKATFSSTNGFLAKDEIYYAPNWPFGVNIIVQDGKRTDIKVNAGFSGPEGEAKVLGGEVLGIPVGSRNKESAVAFIKYLESAPTQEALLTKNGWPSMRTDVYESVTGWQKPYFDETIKALELAEPLPNPPYWDEINTIINDSLKDVVINGKDVETILKDYGARIEKIKKAYEGKGGENDKSSEN